MVIYVKFPRASRWDLTLPNLALGQKFGREIRKPRKILNIYVVQTEKESCLPTEIFSTFPMAERHLTNCNSNV